ncbi:MAG: hypothetical protein H2174_08880 [Vampirovibrio sp.]|nr:hypothetical protein [Vampirovibrio sp.]
MMFFNKKKPEQPINASAETDLFTDDFNEEDSPSTAVATSKPVVKASGSVSGGFQFPTLSPSAVTSKIQSQQHGAFSSQSSVLPNEDDAPISVEAISNQVQSIASDVAVEPLPEVVSQPLAEAVVLETPLPAVQESAPVVVVTTFAPVVPPEPIELEPLVPPVSSSPSVAVDDFDMSLDLSSFAEETASLSENFPDFSLDVPYLPEPEELSSSLPPQAIASPIQISAHEIGSMVLDPLEDTADQISLQTRHAVAGTEAYTQTQFSPIDSSIDLTGLAVEDSYSTMAEANALNQDWVLQDIAVAEEQVALNAPQQPTLTGFASVAEGASLETMDVSQFEAYETGLDFGMDFQENAQVATANLSIEPTAITETTWSVKPEADFTLVEQSVTQPTGISVNDNLMVLDDAFDFADVVPIQELSLINGNVTRTGEPIAQSATALQESYQINEYDEVVVDFDSGTLALDATSAPDVLLSSIGTVANEPVQSAHTLVNGVNEYDEVVVDFDSGTLALDATSAPDVLLSSIGTVANEPVQSAHTLVNGVNEYDEVVVDFDSGTLALDATSAPDVLLSSIGTVANEPVQSAHTLVNGVNEYDEVVVDFDSGTLALDATSAPDVLLSSIGTVANEPVQSAHTLVNGVNEYDEVVVDFDSGTLALDATSAPDVLLSSIGTVANEPVQSAQQEIENETTVANLEEEVSTEEALSTTSSAAADGMISLAEVVGSYLAPALKEQGNILGLSAENQVLPVGVVLPFYDLALEKIKVVAALPLEIENSALLYLEIEPFYALFGFVNNQFKLLHTFQKNVLTEVPDASLMLGLNATSTTEGSIYKLTIGLWEALVTVTPEQVNLVKIVNHA